MNGIPEQFSPAKARTVARQLRRMRMWRLLEYVKMVYSGHTRVCPVCGYRGEFAPVGEPPRLDGICPSCRSRERHRQFKLWLDREQRIDGSKAVLHFAPEPFLTPYIRSISGSYVTADLKQKGVDLALDIEKLDLRDESFDVIIAHQILEHVDHRTALAECFRCLRPGGLLIVTTPIIEAWEKTYENPAIVTSRDRVLHFGQNDHVRYFGQDLRDDMRSAGFEIEEYVAVEPDVSTYALLRGETLFVLSRPARQVPEPLQAKSTEKG